MTLELQLKNTEELSVTEKQEIEQFIEHTISAHKNNRSEINKLTMESVTCLAVSESRARELASQGSLKRGWNNLTGKNQKIRAEIDRNVAKSQYAAQQTIQKLAEQNLITFDLVSAVNNKLNTLVLDIDKEINQVYKTLIRFFKQTRSDLLQIESRLEKVERNVSLLNWNTTIEYQVYEGIDYAELKDIEKLICVTNDFYTVSNGEWSIEDLMLLKATLADVGLDIKGTLSYLDFFMYLIENPKVIDRLFKDINLEYLTAIEPIQASLAKAIEKTIKIDNEEKYIFDTISEQLEQASVTVDQHQLKLSIIKQYLKNNAYTSTDNEVNIFDFSLELLVNLNIISQAVSQLSIPTSPIEIVDIPIIKIGNYVEFGMYKGQKIVWRVINNEENTYMLFSNNIIEKMTFGGEGDWVHSTIRKFLNEEHQFLKEFSFYEIDSIIQAESQYIAWHDNEKILKYEENVLDCCSNYDAAFKKTSGDKVFLLSMLEIVSYLRNSRLDYRPLSNGMSKCYWLRDTSTQPETQNIRNSGNYAADKYIAKHFGNGNFNGIYRKRVRSIFEDGRVGECHCEDYEGVRPAVYINNIKPVSGTGTIKEPFRFFE